ncbi:MAG: hypothetical protein GXP33_03785 [Spirochaetes bacterium]|nr:hypothetical protein [Spirochaetota bacterium]
MTPEERFYTAICRKTPDRVPSFPKIWVDLASKLTGTSLLEIITGPATALDVIFKAGMLCGADGIRQFHFPERKVTQGDDGKVYETDKKGKPIGIIDMEGGLITHLFNADIRLIEDPCFMAHNHYWMSDTPLIRNLSDAERISIPVKQNFKDFGWEKRQKKIIDKNNLKMAIVGDLHSATLAFYVELRGMNRAMFDLLESPELVHAVMEKGTAIAVERGKFNIDMGIKILRLNDSIGNMSVISPDHWRKYIFPHISDVCSELHRYNSSARIYCHICGNILPAAGDLVGTGLDCIGPLDPLGGFKPALTGGIFLVPDA